MIHTIRTVAVGDQESKIDSPIILYRGDREVEVEFTINGSKFTFTNGGNVIKSTNATHGQLVINTPTGENMFSEVTECNNGKVVFVITKEMIDELIEVGFYSFQIRLFDESQVSRVTIPPVLKGIDIRNPIAAEDETNVVDIGLVDYAVVVKDEFEDLNTFLPDGNYNKTEWESKDVISGAKLNKIEDALYNINSNMEASDLALLNRTESINQNVNRQIREFSTEMDNEVEELERSINNNIEKFKIDVNSAMIEHKDNVMTEISSQLDSKASNESLNYTNILLSQKVDKNYVDNEISKKLNGSPKASYVSLSELETTYPRGAEGIFLVQENKHIYSWDGNSWVDLGEYLSNLSNATDLGLDNDNFYSDNVDGAMNELENSINIIKSVGVKTFVNSNSNSETLDGIKDNILLEYSIKNENTNSKMYINAIKIMGRNLLNKDTVINGKYVDDTDGVIKNASTQVVSDFIELTNNTSISFGSIKGIKFSRVVFYDSNKSYIRGVFESNLVACNTTTIPQNAKYVRVSADVNTSTADTWQLEYGKQINKYTDFSNDEFVFDKPVTLNSIGLFGSDVLYSNGKMVIKYLEVTLNNSLNWYKGGESSSNYSFYLTDWCNPNNALYGTENSGIASNTDGYFPIGSGDETNRGINLLANGNLILFIEKTLIDVSSGNDVISKFKNYLSSKPIQFIYRTKENLTKKVKIKEFLISDGVTININTDLIPTVEYLVQKREVEQAKKDYIQLEYAGQIHEGGNYYTSFGGGVMVNGKEYHIFRNAPKHTTINGNYGCVVAYIKDRAGNWITKNLGNLGLTGGEFRDINLSLPLDGTNDIILSGAFYTGVGYEYKNYVFRLSEDLDIKWFEELKGSEGLFSWGNYLFNSEGLGIKCAYDQNFGGTNEGVFLLRKINKDSNEYEKIMLFPPSTVNPNECTIGYYGDKLICIVRQRADVSLYRETYDLTGATGWSVPKKLPFKAHAPNIPCYTPKDKPLIFTFSSVTDELVSQTVRNHRDISITATFDCNEWHKEKIMVENNHYGGYNTFVKNGSGYGMCYYDDYDSTKNNYKDGTDLFYKQIYIEQYLTELDYLEWKYRSK